MTVGLGTGSTAAFAIEALGKRIAKGLRVTTAATSLATERAARAAGIEVLDFADLTQVDLAIDGADEIDPEFRAIKGAGGALLREKIIAASAGRMICVVDATKPVSRLGTAHPLPIEILPFARSFVSAAIESLGGKPVLRRTANGDPSQSDQGNFLIDCQFGPIANLTALATELSVIPGLLGHGLFLTEIDALIVGGPDGVFKRDRTKNPG